MEYIDLTIKTYSIDQSCVFRKTKKEFGGLSNMAGGYPLQINKVTIRTSEALYQACRFPHRSDIQERIILQKSPMYAKMISKKYKMESRSDWDQIQVDVMYWCLRVKLAQNFQTFNNLLLSTTDKTIVEHSRQNNFWGAVNDKSNGSILVGANVLGQLLMILRNECLTRKIDDLLVVKQLDIPDFLLYGEPVQIVENNYL